MQCVHEWHFKSSQHLVRLTGRLVVVMALHETLSARGSRVKVMAAHPGIAMTSLMTNTMANGGGSRVTKCLLPIIRKAVQTQEVSVPRALRPPRPR